MPWRTDPGPVPARWNAIGLAGLLTATALYAVPVAGQLPSTFSRFVLLSTAIVALATGVFGWARGWQHERRLLIVWPIATLVLTVVVGAADVQTTRDLPGVTTLTFAYVGLTQPPGRVWVFLPLGLAAYVIGDGLSLTNELGGLVLTAIMWVLLAELPARLILQLSAQQRALREVARTDALTKLLNRSSLELELGAHDAADVVVLLDVDYFKSFNDAHGHVAGDGLLVEFADTLRDIARDGDLLYRIGGDEFILVLPSTTSDQATVLVENLTELWGKRGFPVGVSYGIAAAGSGALQVADERMYEQKKSRRKATPPCAHCADLHAHASNDSTAH